MIEIVEVELTTINITDSPQARVDIDDDAVGEYAAAYLAGEQLPPVVLFFDGAEYVIADGHHRVRAARNAGLATIPADVRNGGRRDAVLYAVGANAKHGLRRTNADKRRAVEMLLADEEWSSWSDREIARRVGVDHKTVTSIRQKCCVDGEIPHREHTSPM